jgi:hypothetical protein
MDMFMRNLFGKNRRGSKRSPDERSEIRGVMPEWSETGAIVSQAENFLSR